MCCSQDIFGGSETTAPTLEWAMAELVQNPKVMERATAEVRRAFAAHGSVREEKLVEAGLQYLPLVIQETLQLHTPLPFLIPQVCQEPCRVLGYDVPQGITVMVNAWALGRDERYWPGDPDVFRPERFEDVPWHGLCARQHGARACQPPLPLRLGGARRRRA